MRTSIALATALLFAFTMGSSIEASAKQCRDAKGKFIKCESAKTSTRCRDIKTKKFAKCGTSGTEPVPE
jgi:hypothetical protein